MRERRKLVAVSTGRVELEALPTGVPVDQKGQGTQNLPVDQKGQGVGGCGALPHAPAGRSSPCTPGTSCGRAQVATGKPSF